MSRKAYWELLRDPRWQKMRLEVMERDGFSCQDCFATDKTLNVHHTYYAKGRSPWEYEPESLRTLCEDCHAATEAELDDLRRLIGRLDEGDRAIVGAFMRALQAMWTVGGAEISAPDFPQAAGVAAAYGISPYDVERLRSADGRISTKTLETEGLRRAGIWMRDDIATGLEPRSEANPSG